MCLFSTAISLYLKQKPPYTIKPLLIVFLLCLPELSQMFHGEAPLQFTEFCHFGFPTHHLAPNCR